MANVNLRPFLRRRLDLMVLALNAPEQSNENQHWFSGDNSRLYELMFQSGLITKRVPKSTGDEIVFGSTVVNHKGCEFGVADLVDDLVQTQSGAVRATCDHVSRAVKQIRVFQPRFVCVIHSKVRDALNRHAGFSRRLDYGMCGSILPGCPSEFVLNYFPNGNRIPDGPKLAIFRALKGAL